MINRGDRNLNYFANATRNSPLLCNAIYEMKLCCVLRRGRRRYDLLSDLKEKNRDIGKRLINRETKIFSIFSCIIIFGIRENFSNITNIVSNI